MGALMKTPLMVVVVAVVAGAVVACAPPPTCAMSLCGCPESATLRGAGSISGSDGLPVSGVTLSCENSTVLATTDDAGTYSFALETTFSPGCHWGTCNTLTISDSSNRYAEKKLTVFQLADADGGVVLQKR